MKRVFICVVWTCLLGVGGIVIFGGVTFLQSMAVHGQYHMCSNNREDLDAARYWYALENGITNVPGLKKEQLLAYVEEEAFRCPRGGSYSVDPKSLRVVCSKPEHMSDRCDGHGAPTREPEPWSRTYPMDYKDSETWLYVTANGSEGTIFRMSGATILFKDLHGWDWINKVQQMKVSDTGTYNCRFKLDDKGKEVTESYENGIRTFVVAHHTVHISDHGRSLQIDENTFDTSGARPRIVVDGKSATRADKMHAEASGSAGRPGPNRPAPETNQASPAVAPVADLHAP